MSVWVTYILAIKKTIPGDFLVWQTWRVKRTADTDNEFILVPPSPSIPAEYRVVFYARTHCRSHTVCQTKLSNHLFRSANTRINAAPTMVKPKSYAGQRGYGVRDYLINNCNGRGRAIGQIQTVGVLDVLGRWRGCRAKMSGWQTDRDKPGRSADSVVHRNFGSPTTPVPGRHVTGYVAGLGARDPHPVGIRQQGVYESVAPPVKVAGKFKSTNRPRRMWNGKTTRDVAYRRRTDRRRPEKLSATGRPRPMTGIRLFPHRVWWKLKTNVYRARFIRVWFLIFLNFHKY